MGSDIQKRWGCNRADLMKFDADALTIVTDPKHRLYDKEAIEKPVTEEKVANMELLGQLTPILVWLEGEDKQGHPVVFVVNGRQRLKTIREINKRRKKDKDKDPLPVFAVPYKGDDPEAAMFAANSIRDEDDAYAKAKKVKRFIESGHSEADALVVFGFTRQTLSNMMALVDKASPTVQKLVSKGDLTASAAYVVAKLPPEKQEAFAQTVKASTTAAAGPSSRSPSSPSAKPIKGRALQRAVDAARGKTTPSQRTRSVKEWKEMQTRAQAARLPAPAMALIDWALGQDDAMNSYLPDEEEEGEENDGDGGKKRKKK